MRILILGLACLAAAPVFAAGSTTQYTLSHKYVVGGDGGWDYLSFDAASHRLFVSRGSKLQVLDPDKDTLLGEVPTGDGAHGAILAPELNKGFTSNGRANSVTVFDLKTLKATNTIKLTGQGPDAFAYDPVSKRAFFFNGHSNDASVVDAVSEKEIAVIPLDGRPEFAVVDGAGRVYVNIESKSELSEIDAAKAAVTKTWSLAPCDSPSGLAMDTAHRRLFSGCDNKLMVVSDADAGKVVATFPIGDGVDATGFDPGLGLAFSSNGEGSVTVAHEDSPDTYKVIQTVTTEKYARTMTLDPKTHHVYVVTADLKIDPPAKAGERPHRTVLPDSFRVLVLAPQ